MYFKITVLLAFVAVGAMSAVMEYPPGVDPLLCPNYPYCNMEIMGQDIPSYRYYYPYPYYPSYPYARYYAVAPEMTKAMEVKAHDDIVVEAAPAPAPLPKAAEYPADVDPKDCPNYPYCQ